MASLAEVVANSGVAYTQLAKPEYQRVPESPCYVLTVDRTTVFAAWEVLRDQLSSAGYWPVIGWDRFKEPPLHSHFDSPSAILARSEQFDLEEWFAARAALYHRSAKIEEEFSKREYPPFDHMVATKVRSPNLPDNQAPIALVPVDLPWKVPAYLLSITGDEVPEYIHVAVQKYWFERWGAELMAATGGVTDLRILHPPRLDQDCLEVAREMYAYCPDVVNQGTTTIRALATRVCKSSVWSLWWD